MTDKQEFALLLGGVAIIAVAALACDDWIDGVRPRRDPAASSPAAPPPKRCVSERRMHAYGTYQTQARYDLPIDLTITECLRWEE